MQTIVIKDTIAPVINCPGSLAAQCGIAEQPAYANYAAFQAAGGSASDNCAIDPATFALKSEVSDGQHCPETVTRTYRIADLCGNEGTCVQTIVIKDTIAPVINCPGSLAAQCGIAEQPAYANYAAFQAAGGSASDNCAIDPATFALKSEVSDGQHCPETVTRTYRIADLCGNEGTCVQTVVIKDTIAPVITCPPAVVLACGDPSDPAHTGVATATDNCNGTVTITHSDAATPANCTGHAGIDRTWTATDACNNHASCVQHITFGDGIAPTLTAGSIASCYTTRALAEAAAIAATTATDNCGGSPVLTASTVGTCTATITVTATDGCGNHASVQYNTQIMSPPVFGTITAIQNAANVKNCAATTVQGTVNISVQASDACGLLGQPSISLVNGLVTETATSDGESPTGTFNYHWNVTPATSNGTWTVTITVSDSCQSATSQFNLCMNSAQLSGQVQLEGFVGTGTVPLHTRTVTFVATDGPGTNANALKTWTVAVANVSGDTFAYTLSDAPAGTQGLSAKTDWNLRSKVPVTLDVNGQASGLNFTGSKRLRGGDFDGSNTINLDDYTILGNNFFTHTSAADITGDNAVDFDDYSILADNWFTGGDPE